MDEQVTLTDFSVDPIARTEFLEYSARASLQTLLDEADLNILTIEQAQELVDLALQVRRACQSVKEFRS